ncbi:hypothetical protein GA0115240_125521 [Streptomyces sp. DvalAA-14]|uniref:hypothetical protein n=1 Tax=unclassified Streptomyces TaxID=2593676 RepID=UPI00081B5540|nr:MULTISPECIES: hypothetical protein [unclassified Streptomyces]MYS21100.1 hypothetical protein [Streptomyces sp. SID4948]SCD84090.1 hypothetical protein GA0115240_125521 [Streptomyces sp. DvalAA-14]
MSSQIPGLVDELVAQMESGSPRAYRQAMSQLADTARAGGPAELTAAVEALAPLLPGLAGDFAKTAVLAGALVEWGGSPAALAEGLPRRAAEAMMLNASVPRRWAEAAPGRPLPAPESASTQQLLAALTPLAEPHGRPDERDMARIAMSWFDMDDWLMAMITLLGSRSFRAAVPADVKADLRRYAAAVADRSRFALRVGELAAVLDDEPLIVLDPATRRGYALTMSGVGDNYQLHILLADRLIGDPGQGLVAGERPDRSWVEAATGAHPHLGPDNPAVRRFRLFDGHGRYVAPEGKPADIQPLDGVRVLVLHPPGGVLGFGIGRVFEAMTPALHLDRLLGADEAASWFTRVAPAVENDLMGN